MEGTVVLYCPWFIKSMGKRFPGDNNTNPLGGVLSDGFPSVTVCPVLSLFIHVRDVPAGTVGSEGL